jgi:hypothetical protein
MTREEEIKAKSEEYLPDILDDEYPYRAEFVFGFQEGAKWADRTMIDKACDWIQMNATKYMNSIGGCMYFDVINSTKDFKKAMEL